MGNYNFPIIREYTLCIKQPEYTLNSRSTGEYLHESLECCNSMVKFTIYTSSAPHWSLVTTTVEVRAVRTSHSGFIPCSKLSLPF